ncbi:hypothetical protein GJ699_12935 [Duganella sp. FT80W]|uniref:Uncharacterized protein n=2 Tax=Duganella guangzhouensis TaxID=2666084 RepID=A0A6I2L103_9BURK|nr:hypothetical protein [Duganella guangzhouensis]
MMSTDLATLAPPLLALGTGVVSALLYARKRRWADALLAGVAGAALAVTIADVRLPTDGTSATATSIAVGTAAGRLADADRAAIPAAAGIVQTGDGLRDAEWRDLPARPLQWKPAAADLLWLDFPRSISLGRIFTLTVRRPQSAAWRLQLLAENKQVLADSGTPSAASQLSVQWLAPVAENMVLQARLLDANGKTIAQGPIPLQVKDAVPLQIQGRFDAPSFDARVLNQLLADGGAIMDWNVTLGKAITRSETARAPLTTPNAIFVDAAYVEHLSPAARGSLLAQAAQGITLVILGGSAADVSMWQRELGLYLHPQSPTTEKEDVRQFGVTLAMPPATLNPADNAAAPWSVLARDVKKQPWMWQRAVGQGQVVWMGVMDWHKYAISEPHLLTLWWQSAMDRIALESPQKTAWQLNDPMPVPGLRSEVCAQGVKPGAALTVTGQPPLAMQPRSDKADGVCAAFWPRQAGWVQVSAEGMTEQGSEYVYAAGDWPAWQRALRRDATAVYVARATPSGIARADAGTAGMGGEQWPSWPTAIVFALALFGLWWREQRGGGSRPSERIGTETD